MKGKDNKKVEIETDLPMNVPGETPDEVQTMESKEDTDASVEMDMEFCDMREDTMDMTDTNIKDIMY